MLDHWKRGHELIFVDEATVNPWQNYLRMWQPKPKGERFHLYLRPNRGQGISIHGAISNKRPEFQWQLADKSDSTTFLPFIKQLSKWPENPQYPPFRLQRVVFVMDGARYHLEQGVVKYIQDLGAGLLLLPSSSSELNPVGM